MCGKNQYGVPSPGKGSRQGNSGLIGVFHIRSPEKFVENDKEPPSLSKLSGDFFNTLYFCKKVAGAHAKIIRQIDGRINTIQHGKLHPAYRDRESHMSKEQGYAQGLHKSGFPRHIGPGEEEDMVIGCYIQRIGNGMLHLWMINALHTDPVLLRRQRKGECEPSFNSHPAYGNVHVQLINVLQQPSGHLPVTEAQVVVIDHYTVIRQFAFTGFFQQGWQSFECQQRCDSCLFGLIGRGGSALFQKRVQVLKNFYKGRDPYVEGLVFIIFRYKARQPFSQVLWFPRQPGPFIGDGKISFGNVEQLPLERERSPDGRKVLKNSAAPVDGRCIAQRMTEHFFQQYRSITGGRSVKDAIYRVASPPAQYIQLAQCLLLCNHAHVIIYFLLRLISRIPPPISSRPGRMPSSNILRKVSPALVNSRLLSFDFGRELSIGNSPLLNQLNISVLKSKLQVLGL